MFSGMDQSPRSHLKIVYSIVYIHTHTLYTIYMLYIIYNFNLDSEHKTGR